MSRKRVSAEALHPEGLTEPQEALVLSLCDAGVVLFDFEQGWRLKHHEQHPEAPLSPFYIDLRLLQSFPVAKYAAVSALIEQAGRLEYDYIAGIPISAIALASSMSDRMGIPQITPRMDQKVHGRKEKLIDGVYEAGKIALVVDDLVTDAGTKLEAIEKLEQGGLVVKDVVVVLDREQGGMKQLAERGYALHAALKITPTLTFYRRMERISQEELDYILDYLAAPLG